MNSIEFLSHHTAVLVSENHFHSWIEDTSHVIVVILESSSQVLNIFKKVLEVLVQNFINNAE
jgi:hypothetical protein